MNRILPASVLLLALAAASIVTGQVPSPSANPSVPVAPAASITPGVTMRTPGGDRPVNVSYVNGQTYFSAEDVIAGLGGSMARDANGFKATLNGNVAAFGPDSRFGVVRDDLIEMPAPPVALEGHPYVPLQFFQGFLSKTSPLELVWDATTRLLLVRTAVHDVISLQMSVANVQGISKIVLTLSGPAEYGIVKQQGSYTILFRTAIQAPFAEQSFDDPNVSKATFTGNELRIQLTAPDVAGDAYKLDNPVRIVLDLRKGAPAGPGAAVVTPSRTVEQPGIHTIVIDPGHGGKDVGASGAGGLMEKDATLALCRKLAAALGSKIGARVVLTREDDSVVSLDQRTAIANQYHADLFLSVHMNAAVVKGAHGSETYFLSADASDALAQRAADAENATGKATAGPQPPSADLKLILWDLAQQEYLSESSKLAQTIQEEMNAVTAVPGRGVKQAPFKVLVGATMPAALVEVAFISNPDEEAKLKKEEFQTSVVDAITRAVQRYKTEYETRIGLIKAPVAVPAHHAPPAAAAPASKAGT